MAQGLWQVPEPKVSIPEFQNSSIPCQNFFSLLFLRAVDSPRERRSGGHSNCGELISLVYTAYVRRTRRLTKQLRSYSSLNHLEQRLLFKLSELQASSH